MLRSKLLLLALIYSAVTSTKAELTNVVSSTPSMDGFKNILDFSVDYYTGLPDIKNDVFSFYVDGIEFPISLAYHASVKRVDRTASTVGIGWNLIPVGMEGYLQNALKLLQESSILSEVLMTYYTYNTLIGVTSIMDPKGYIT